MKIFAFILGVLFGIVAVFGAVFVAVATVTPDTLTGGTASETLGDIGKLSFMSIFNKVRDAFSTQGKFYRYKTDDDFRFVHQFRTAFTKSPLRNTSIPKTA